MDVLTRTKLKLAKMLNIKYASVETDKGPLEFDGEELLAGTIVFQMDENGNLEPAADGQYTLTDGRVATVVSGEVSEITSEDGQTEETELEEVVPPAETVDGEVTPEDFNDLVQIVNSLNTEVIELKEEVQDIGEDYKKEKAEHSRTRAELSKIKADFAKAVGANVNIAETGDTKAVNPARGMVDERTEKAIKFMAGK